MKAAIRRTYGSPDQIRLEDTQQPQPQADEVLIKVHATTVNRTDCANLTARPFLMRFVLGLWKPRQIILGTDVAGEVVAIGEKVQSFAPGDRVFGFNDTGAASQAEYTVMSEEKLFPIPDQLDYGQAAASLEGAHYAYSSVQKTNIQAGQRILVNGATGAIGSALLQFVRQYEVEITATCEGANQSRIEALGADRIIDYTREDFTKSQGSYDFIFDAVGKSTFGQCKPLLTEQGVYISSELGPFAQNIWYAFLGSKSGKRVIFPIPFPTRESIPYIRERLMTGVFKPLMDREYDLASIADAYTYVLSGQKIGNVVLRIR